VKLLETIKSKQDKTIKNVFLSRDNVMEFSYIDKSDGKDIVVVPTQTACNLGCKFCFLTGLNIPVRNLFPYEMIDGVKFTLINSRDENEILLVSFMGCGEPLLNIDRVIKAMNELTNCCYEYNLIRFAVASLIPSTSSIEHFTNEVARKQLLVKFHYSLHTTNNVLRKQLMPAAIPYKAAVIYLKRYKELTKNAVEIHYSLMKGVNDSEQDAKNLVELISGAGFNVKILKLSEKDSELTCSDKVAQFRAILTDSGIDNEYYEPPGNDVGSSCGQFLLDYYTKYSK
jgi:23S rRNA (adenine2503-C2)-methyltransferase